MLIVYCCLKVVRTHPNDMLYRARKPLKEGMSDRSGPDERAGANALSISEFMLLLYTLNFMPTGARHADSLRLYIFVFKI